MVFISKNFNGLKKWGCCASASKLIEKTEKAECLLESRKKRTTLKELLDDEAELESTNQKEVVASEIIAGNDEKETTSESGAQCKPLVEKETTSESEAQCKPQEVVVEEMVSHPAEAWRRFQAAEWLESLVGPLGISTDPSEKDFINCLRNGLFLCNAINKINQGAETKVVENSSYVHSFNREPQLPPAYQYIENVRDFVVTVQELKLPAFEASDIEWDVLEAGSTAKVVDCILALKSYHEWKLRNSCRRLDMSTASEKQPHVIGQNQMIIAGNDEKETTAESEAQCKPLDEKQTTSESDAQCKPQEVVGEMASDPGFLLKEEDYGAGMASQASLADPTPKTQSVKGVKVCHKCGWFYPNLHPGKKCRNAHRKVCGSIEGYRVHSENSNLSQPHHFVFGSNSSANSSPAFGLSSSTFSSEAKSFSSSSGVLGSTFQSTSSPSTGFVVGTPSEPHFVFGSRPRSGARHFQFGGQQNLSTPQNGSSSFHFTAGGTFSFVGGVEKPERKIVKVNKLRNRKKETC